MNDADVEEGGTGKPWTRLEVEATVAAYLHMLRLELLGQACNKREHNRQLQALIPDRSIASIEYKHRNVSAVLIECGVMPLTGYKPLFNYQHMLAETVVAALADDPKLDAAALHQVEIPAEAPRIDSFDGFVVDKPLPRMPPPQGVMESRRPWSQRSLVQRDYLAREARNRSLGQAGELLVMAYEARRLHELGAKTLASRIEHVSARRGDGAGFDILSFESDGRERFIEVKTTAYVAETPFYVSGNELAFSTEQSGAFHLYRLFEFRQHPRMFVLTGALGTSCKLDPVTYQAEVRSG